MGLLKILNQIFPTAAFLLLAVSLSAQEKTIKAGEKIATVSAQLSDTQNMITTDLKPIEVSDKKFSILAGFEFSQKIAADERSDRESGTDLLIAPSYKISETFILGAKTILSNSLASPACEVSPESRCAISPAGTVSNISRSAGVGFVLTSAATSLLFLPPTFARDSTFR